METIYKTTTKNTYFKGEFYLRCNKNTNWAHPINFPTVFVAFGKAIKSGNWSSCTSINTSKYVIREYFNNDNSSLKKLWEFSEKLEDISYSNVSENKEEVLKLINLANNELSKLKTF